MRSDIACPHCDRVNNAHDGAEAGHEPTHGDVSLCWACRRPSIFETNPVTGQLGLRTPTAEEAERIAANGNVRAALAAMAESYTPAQALGLTRRGGVS